MPQCELRGKFPIYDETEMVLRKKVSSKHHPQICGQFGKKSIQHRWYRTGFWSWPELPLESFYFYLCDPDLVNFIEP